MHFAWIWLFLMHDHCMEDPKQRIKDWLNAHGRDREWLAGKLPNTKKRTVDNWLSSPQDIPLSKLLQIERLMQDEEASEALRRLQLLPQAQIFSLEVDLPSFRAYSAAALKANQTLEQWSIAELNAAAEAALAPPQQEDTQPPEDTTEEIIQRETEIAGQKITIIGPNKYGPPPEQQNRAAEEPPEQP